MPRTHQDEPPILVDAPPIQVGANMTAIEGAR
jgi:hypothetical protein